MPPTLLAEFANSIAFSIAPCRDGVTVSTDATLPLLPIGPGKRQASNFCITRGPNKSQTTPRLGRKRQKSTKLVAIAGITHGSTWPIANRRLPEQQRDKRTFRPKHIAPPATHRRTHYRKTTITLALTFLVASHRARWSPECRRGRLRKGSDKQAAKSRCGRMNCLEDHSHLGTRVRPSRQIPRRRGRGKSRTNNIRHKARAVRRNRVRGLSPSD